jgi:hypothetical protein
MYHILLSTKLQKFIDRVKKQYSDDESPYRLNSSYHKTRIDINFPNIFLFISSGLLKFETFTQDNGNRHVQGMKFVNYNVLILSVIYMYIIGINEDSILKIMRQLFLKSHIKLSCSDSDKSFQFWGSAYWLTKDGSKLGPPENRFPKVRNPITKKTDVDPGNKNRLARKRFFCCKHLMACIFFFTNEKNMNEISRKMLPHIYKSYGVKHVGGKEQLLRKIGSKGIKKMYLQCVEKLNKVDASLVSIFNTVVVKSSNELITKMNLKKIKDFNDDKRNKNNKNIPKPVETINVTQKNNSNNIDNNDK